VCASCVKEKEKLRTQDTPEAWIKEGGFSCEKPPPLPPARLELGTFEDKSSQPQFNVMLRTKLCNTIRGRVNTLCP